MLVHFIENGFMRGDMMKTVYITDCGKIRAHNEDNGGVFRNGENKVLAVVADGMGGHRAGDVASELTLSFIQKEWENLTEDLTIESAIEWLKTTIYGANSYVFDYALNNEQCRGMGTTVVMAYCTDEFISIGHVGDSRCYIFSEGRLNQLTEDHSLVNELVRSGQLSKQDAEFHPKKNVLLRALGTESHLDVDTKTIHWQQGQMIVLCSDGLTNKVTDQQLESVLNSEKTLDEKASELIEMANGAGGEDNITLSIVMNTNGESE